MTSRDCPICKKPMVTDYRPFCSRRCADVDLQRWLTGRYALGDEGESELDALRPDEASGSPVDR